MKTTQFWLWLMILSLVSCQGNSDIKDETDLIGDQTCSPPCWKGIVPGNTTRDQAVSILEEMEKDGKGTLAILPDDIAWYSNKTYYLHIQEDTISQISFSVSETTVEKLIERFGKPQGVSVGETGHDEYSIILYYPEDGLLFYAGGKYKSGSSYEEIITPDMPITLVYFIAPTDLPQMIEVVHGANWVEKLLPHVQEWKDYGEIAP